MTLMAAVHGCGNALGVLTLPCSAPCPSSNHLYGTEYGDTRYNESSHDVPGKTRTASIHYYSCTLPAAASRRTPRPAKRLNNPANNHRHQQHHFSAHTHSYHSTRGDATLPSNFEDYTLHVKRSLPVSGPQSRQINA